MPVLFEILRKIVSVRKLESRFLISDKFIGVRIGKSERNKQRLDFFIIVIKTVNCIKMGNVFRYPCYVAVDFVCIKLYGFFKRNGSEEIIEFFINGITD